MVVVASAKRYVDGALILRQGEHADCMYVVRQGKVRIFRTDRDTETTLGFIHAGGMFGEMSLFEDLPRSASAQAVGEVEVDVISRAEFESLSCDPTVKRVLRQMAGRLREIDVAYEHLSVDADQRRKFLSTIPLRHDYEQS